MMNRSDDHRRYWYTNDKGKMKFKFVSSKMYWSANTELGFRSVTFDFGNAEGREGDHVFVARIFTTTGCGIVAHVIAPNVPFRAVARDLTSNNQTLWRVKRQSLNCAMDGSTCFTEAYAIARSGVWVFRQLLQSFPFISAGSRAYVNTASVNRTLFLKLKRRRRKKTNMFQHNTCYQFGLLNFHRVRRPSLIFYLELIGCIHNWKDGLSLQCDVTFHHQLSNVDFVYNNNLYCILVTSFSPNPLCATSVQGIKLCSPKTTTLLSPFSLQGPIKARKQYCFLNVVVTDVMEVFQGDTHPGDTLWRFPVVLHDNIAEWLTYCKDLQCKNRQD